MFNTKKDRYIIELAIEFNLSAINKWLNKSGKEEDIAKISKDWGNDDVWLNYYIDVLPSGQSSDMYHHRKRGVISNNVGGTDFLENVDQNIEHFLKSSNIKMLAWEPWREFLSLEVNKKLILLAPVEEFVELQVNRVLKNGGSPKDEEKKIKVPISFDDQNNPEELIEIWRGSASNRSVGFSNALCSISASTLNFEVEY
ncbi:MAG: hypothetical protein KAS07_04805 [Candidatus Pacebacteria bacterium]|nr:hypothetical protein [Candidatus Paceibacterota bacterium]